MMRVVMMTEMSCQVNEEVSRDILARLTERIRELISETG